MLVDLEYIVCVCVTLIRNFPTADMVVLVSCHVYKGKNKFQIKRVLKLARLSCGSCYRLESSDSYCLARRPCLWPRANK